MKIYIELLHPIINHLHLVITHHPVQPKTHQTKYFKEQVNKPQKKKKKKIQ